MHIYSSVEKRMKNRDLGICKVGSTALFASDDKWDGRQKTGDWRQETGDSRQQIGECKTAGSRRRMAEGSPQRLGRDARMQIAGHSKTSAEKRRREKTKAQPQLRQRCFGIKLWVVGDFWDWKKLCSGVEQRTAPLFLFVSGILFA